jgi:L-threonate 2-dehydrogenase
MEVVNGNIGSVDRHVGIVGLGIMGGAMAAGLLEDGIFVDGYDVSPDARAAFTAVGGRVVPSPSALAKGMYLVITSLPSSEALAAVINGPGGLAESAPPGLLVVETSTLPLSDKEAARRNLEERGALLIDCPISGTGAQAITRDLVFFASGEATAVDRARPVLERLARRVEYVGPFGAGSKLKYVANLLVAVHNVATAEAVLLAKAAGLDLRMVYDVLITSAASSRILQLRMPLMVDNQYKPATTKMETFSKDIEIIHEWAAALACPTPLLSAVRPVYAAAIAQGMADLDTAAVCAVLESMAIDDVLSEP